MRPEKPVYLQEEGSIELPLAHHPSYCPTSDPHHHHNYLLLLLHEKVR
jgi:hypothetical protein